MQYYKLFRFFDAQKKQKYVNVPKKKLLKIFSELINCVFSAQKSKINGPKKSSNKFIEGIISLSSA